MTDRRQKRVSHEEAETRNAILRAAQELFMRYGYRSVTTRQLAEVCGLTQPALYHYFSDKESLYLAVVSEEIARVKVALERITRRSEDVAERLKHVTVFLLGRVQYDLSLMLHDVRYELSAESRALLDKQFRDGFILPLAALFEQGVQQGLLRPVEDGGLAPLQCAYFFMTLLSAFAREPRDEGSLHAKPAQHTATAELVVRLFLHGLARPDRP